MGIDFIRLAAPSFRKAWDRHRVNLCTPDLLTKPIAEAKRTVLADLVGCRAKTGDAVIVERAASHLVARIGLEVVARLSQPTNDFCAIVDAGAGVAKGVIEVVHELSGQAEISIS